MSSSQNTRYINMTLYQDLSLPNGSCLKLLRNVQIYRGPARSSWASHYGLDTTVRQMGRGGEGRELSLEQEKIFSLIQSGYKANEICSQFSSLLSSHQKSQSLFSARRLCDEGKAEVRRQDWSHHITSHHTSQCHIELFRWYKCLDLICEFLDFAAGRRILHDPDHQG